MKKYVNAAFGYMLFGLFMGLFYREFTRYMDVTWDTRLSVIHTHSLSMGMLFFLIVAILVKVTNVAEQKLFRQFYVIYNAGFGLTLMMLVARGLYEAMKWNSAMWDGSITGFAGIGHILMSVALWMLFVALRRAE